MTSNHSDFIPCLNKALDPGLTMRLLQQQKNLNTSLYVGLWAIWLVDEHFYRAKIVICTVKNENAPEKKLSELSWSIMQLQSVEQSDAVWPSLETVLRDDIAEFLKIQEPCQQNKITFDSRSTNSILRPFRATHILENYRLLRQEEIEENEKNSRPVSTLQRTRIPYHVLDIEGNKLPVQVFVERPVPKNMALGHKINMENGFVKKGNLLAAIGEWKTWIVYQG